MCGLASLSAGKSTVGCTIPRNCTRLPTRRTCGGGNWSGTKGTQLALRVNGTHPLLVVFTAVRQRVPSWNSRLLLSRRCRYMPWYGACGRVAAPATGRMPPRAVVSGTCWSTLGWDPLANTVTWASTRLVGFGSAGRCGGLAGVPVTRCTENPVPVVVTSATTRSIRFSEAAGGSGVSSTTESRVTRYAPPAALPWSWSTAWNGLSVSFTGLLPGLTATRPGAPGAGRSPVSARTGLASGAMSRPVARRASESVMPVTHPGCRSAMVCSPLLCGQIHASDQ